MVHIWYPNTFYFLSWNVFKYIHFVDYKGKVLKNYFIAWTLKSALLLGAWMVHQSRKYFLNYKLQNVNEILMWTIGPLGGVQRRAKFLHFVFSFLLTNTLSVCFWKQRKSALRPPWVLYQIPFIWKLLLLILTFN